MQHLMHVACNHIPHAILLGELMQREVRISQYRGNQPGGPVRDDELHRLRPVRLQVLFEKRQFIGRKILRAAVVQNREMRLLVAEAVVRRVTGILPEQPLRLLRPDVVISRSEIEGITPIRRQNPLYGLPLPFSGCVAQALNGVPDRNHERRIIGRRFPPSLLEDTSLRLARAVAKDHEPKCVRPRRRRERYQQGQQSGYEAHLAQTEVAPPQCRYFLTSGFNSALISGLSRSALVITCALRSIRLGGVFPCSLSTSVRTAS